MSTINTPKTTAKKARARVEETRRIARLVNNRDRARNRMLERPHNTTRHDNDDNDEDDRAIDLRRRSLEEAAAMSMTRIGDVDERLCKDGGRLVVDGWR